MRIHILCSVLFCSCFRIWRLKFILFTLFLGKTHEASNRMRSHDYNGRIEKRLRRLRRPEIAIYFFLSLALRSYFSLARSIYYRWCPHCVAFSFSRSRKNKTRGAKVKGYQFSKFSLSLSFSHRLGLNFIFFAPSSFIKHGAWISEDESEFNPPRISASKGETKNNRLKRQK